MTKKSVKIICSVVFQHIKYVTRIVKGFCCRLHNYMLEMDESHINAKFSLIVCEGISVNGKACLDAKGFPHLYRAYQRAGARIAHSLIVCEGVSFNCGSGHDMTSFPHCA